MSTLLVSVVRQPNTTSLASPSILVPLTSANGYGWLKKQTTLKMTRGLRTISNDFSLPKTSVGSLTHLNLRHVFGDILRVADGHRSALHWVET